MSDLERLSYLRLARSTNVGCSLFFRLLDIFGSAQESLKKLDEVILSEKLKLKRKITICSQEKIEKEIYDTTNFGARIITAADHIYPLSLKQIVDPPPILTVKGREEFLSPNYNKIAVVGPRNASFNSTILAKRTALELGIYSVIVVSGMARGIDSIAHKATVRTGTIAVIAGGINNIYPKENEKLYHKIAEKGLLISENPFNSPPHGGLFVRRNRIISGLSLAVIVVEAGEKSGTLITAECAQEQGRKLFVFPGSPMDPKCKGSNDLLAEGNSIICRHIRDIIRELPQIKERVKKPTILQEPEAKPFIPPIAKIPDEKEISKLRDEIYQKLSSTPIEIEEIIRLTEAPAKFVNIALVQLELADKIIVHLNKVMLRHNY